MRGTEGPRKNAARAVVRAAQAVEIASPDGKVRARIFDGDDGELFYNVKRDGTTVVRDSPLGVTGDGAQLALCTVLGPSRGWTVKRRYPCWVDAGFVVE